MDEPILTPSSLKVCSVRWGLLSAAHSAGLDRNVVTHIHHRGLLQCHLATLIILRALPVQPSLLTVC